MFYLLLVCLPQALLVIIESAFVGGGYITGIRHLFELEHCKLLCM